MARRRRIAAVLCTLVLLLLGGAVYLRLQARGDHGPGTEAVRAPDGESTESSMASLALPVEGGRVVRDTLVLTVAATGEAAAARRVVVTAQVAGRVESLRVREGDAVRSGQPLVILDATEFELAVADAGARLRQATAEFEVMTVFDDGIEDEHVRRRRHGVARARSGLDAAEVALRRAELDLSRTRMHAPFAGRVASLRVVPGQWVRPGDELLTVVDLDPIRVEVQVLESEIDQVAVTGSAGVSFTAFPGQLHRGRVVTINPLVEDGTRTARVSVLVPNPGGRILPGMYARVALDGRRYPDRLLVPRSAILERDRRSLVFVYDGDGQVGLARWRYVTTGLENDSLVEILEDSGPGSVQPGDVVLTDGHFTLVHDARVRLTGAVAPESPGTPSTSPR